MHVYLVSYDLNVPGQDYDKLMTAIKSFPDSCHALKSQWFVCSSKPVQEVYEHLRKFIDDDDYLFISEVNLDSQVGWLDDPVAAWLRSALLRL